VGRGGEGRDARGLSGEVNCDRAQQREMGLMRLVHINCLRRFESNTREGEECCERSSPKVYKRTLGC
jgi:hypothetical protein